MCEGMTVEVLANHRACLEAVFAVLPDPPKHKPHGTAQGTTGRHNPGSRAAARATRSASRTAKHTGAILLRPAVAQACTSVTPPAQTRPRLAPARGGWSRSRSP